MVLSLNEFYVYGHYRNDTNQLFYVGKGKDRRAYAKKNRNKHWTLIADKYGYTVYFFYKDLSEKEAYDLEKAVIADTAPEANYAPGGPICGTCIKGFLGKKHTEEHKLYMSNLYKGRQMRKMDESYKKQLKAAGMKRAKKVLDSNSQTVYESIRECSRGVGISKSGIISMIKRDFRFKVV